MCAGTIRRKLRDPGSHGRQTNTAVRTKQDFLRCKTAMKIQASDLLTSRKHLKRKLQRSNTDKEKVFRTQRHEQVNTNKNLCNVELIRRAILHLLRVPVKRKEISLRQR